MSRHEGVSCDSCMKSNFRGKRYKCLICYDYDLCATCYEAGATTTRHTADHPMQCILTRTDFDLYYGGEALTAEQPQAFTCPYCGKMGYTEAALQEHVTDHADTAIEVVCPVCAALPGGDPNHVTDDFPAHLTLEHRAPREFQDEPIGGIRHVRRIPHPGRGMGGQRARRTNMHFQSAGSALSGLSPSSRETTMDPIAELLSQLSNVRSRAAAAQNVSSQLQQLEMQLQSTRQDGRLELTMLPLGLSRQSLSRQQLEKLPRRQAEAVSKAGAAGAQQAATVIDLSSGVGSAASNNNSQFLLARFGESDLTESERQSSETERADRSLFVQELLLSTLAEGLRLDDSLPESPLLTSIYPEPVDESDSHPKREPEPPVGGSGGGVDGGSGGGLGGDGGPPSGESGGPPPSGKGQHPGQASSSSGSGGAEMGAMAGAGAGIGMGATGTVAGQGLPAAASSGGGIGGSSVSGAATSAGPPSRSDRRDKPTGTHRNMVKRLESNKKLEKEPPPVMKPRVSHH